MLPRSPALILIDLQSSVGAKVKIHQMELPAEMAQKAVEKVDLLLDGNPIEKDIATAVKVCASRMLRHRALATGPLTPLPPRPLVAPRMPRPSADGV